MKKKTAYWPDQALVLYFNKLDQVALSEQGLFRRKEDKEDYETRFMYALRKYKAAQYHLGNIQRFVADDVKRAKLDLDRKEPASKHIEGYTRTQRETDYYIYELSAFFEAVKSTLDFLLIAVRKHFPQLDWKPNGSISLAVKQVKNHEPYRQAPFLNCVFESLEWLDFVRSYRRHLVHLRTISAKSGHEIRTKHGNVVDVRIPVVVPTAPPPYKPDTRKTRDIFRAPSNVTLKEETPSIDETSGGSGDLEYRCEYLPSCGFVIIEDFVAEHLGHLGTFFLDVIESLEPLNFQVWNPQRKSSKK
jgi:hypothetical protein